MGLDDGTRNRQADTHSLRLGGHERLEQMGTDFCRRATTKSPKLQAARRAVAGQALPVHRPPIDAHDVLGPALQGFSPTPEFPQVREALELVAKIKTTPQF